MQSLLQSALLSPIESVINLCLSQDAHLAQQVTRFEHKCIQVTAQRPNVMLTINFYQDSIGLSPLSAQEMGLQPDACIEGNSEDLIALLLRSAEDRPLANPSLSISGDVMLIQDIYQCLQNLDIQWEDYLTPILGDVVSNALSELVNDGKAWLQESHQRAKQNLKNYLTEESQTLVAKDELPPLLDRIDRLRLRVDRLQARSARVKPPL